MRRKKYIGLVLIVFSVLLFVFWEAKGREMINTEEILVFKENVDKNQIIEKEMFDIRNVNWAADEAIRACDMDLLIGMETTGFIHRNAPLFKEYFDKAGLIPNGEMNEYVMAVPNNWILSYPQSLRRGDLAFFYCDGELITKSRVAYAKDCSNKEVVSVDYKRLEGSSNISLVEIILNKVQADRLYELANKGNRFVIMYN